MISRYTRPAMAEIWSDQVRFQIWLEIEMLALEKMVQEGLAPQQAIKDFKAKAKFDTARVLELEETLKHDVIAFLTNLAESVGESSKYVHRGMTSSDLLDTALAVQLKRAGKLLLVGIDKLMQAVRKRAEEFKYTACIGRSHGIHAEPTTFGLKLISWYAEIKRQRHRLDSAISEISVGKIAGAVGTYASIPAVVEKHVLQGLGLKAEPAPSQIVHRDRHAYFFSVLALLASSLERFAVEIRHLQRTEVREVEEKFSAGQKGSSAMPHKRNPILSENISGLARLVRGYSISAMENIALWHERDISHSSVERVMAPDTCILCDFMLHRFCSIVEGLQVYTDHMLENLELTRGLVFSGTVLIALVDKGILREDAYGIVQRHSLAAWEGGAGLKERLGKDREVKSVLTEAELEQAFDLNRHFSHVDLIFSRAIE